MMSEERAEYMNSPVDELKPCPCGGKMAWCGDQPQEFEDGTIEQAHDCHQLVCLKCEMQIDYNCEELRGCSAFEEMRKIVATKWNTRAESPDSVEEAGQSRSTPPPVAGGEKAIDVLVQTYNAGYQHGHHDTVESCFTDIGFDDLEFHREVVTDFIAESDLAALQHQDCVVISKECADAALNDMKSIRAMCMRAEMYPSHKQLAELEQSLERKNESD